MLPGRPAACPPRYRGLPGPFQLRPPLPVGWWAAPPAGLLRPWLAGRPARPFRVLTAYPAQPDPCPGRPLTIQGTASGVPEECQRMPSRSHAVPASRRVGPLTGLPGGRSPDRADRLASSSLLPSQPANWPLRGSWTLAQGATVPLAWGVQPSARGHGAGGDRSSLADTSLALLGPPPPAAQAGPGTSNAGTSGNHRARRRKPAPPEPGGVRGPLVGGASPPRSQRAARGARTAPATPWRGTRSPEPPSTRPME